LKNSPARQDRRLLLNEVSVILLGDMNKTEEQRND
jgi:hypothetical protein